MKTKVAWRCQEIFFFAEWSLYIKSKWYIFSWGPSWQFLHNTSTADESRHCHDKYRSFFAAKQQQMQKMDLSNQFRFALIFLWLHWIDRNQRAGSCAKRIGLAVQVQMFFHNLLFFAQSTWSGPLNNPKELQLTLSTTYILKSGSGKTNYKICLGTKPALMDCLLNVLS